MSAQPDARSDAIPLTSILFGYGPMLPLAAAAAGAWLLAPPWPETAVRLAILWGAMILTFVAGVRRGYGFGDPAASTGHAITAMLAYFIPAGLALVAGAYEQRAAALGLLLGGFALVIVLDRRAALAGDAPAHFARLRGPQMLVAVVALAFLLVRVAR